MRIDVPRGPGFYIPKEPTAYISINSEGSGGFLVKPVARNAQEGLATRGVAPYDLFSVSLRTLGAPISVGARGVVENYLKSLEVGITNLHRLDDLEDEVPVAYFGVEVSGHIAGSKRYGIGELSRRVPPPTHDTFLEFIKLHNLSMNARRDGFSVEGQDERGIRKLLDF